MSGKLELAFDILARDKASPALDKVGDKAERTGAKVEHGSARGQRAFGLLGRTLATSSQGALGPIGELTEKLAVFNEAVETGGKGKAGGRILGVGLAATAAGSFIEGLHAKEQAAQQQLAASIETTGHSYAQYAEEVEKAVKSGERFGNQASTTVDALNRLTITTHNPEEAFKGLQVAIDVAAAKHIPLAKAAEVVGLTFNGSTRAGKQFGLKLEDVGKSAAALTAAQKAAASANEAAKNAQTSYTEKLDLWNQSSTKTTAQAYALRDAHTRLIESQQKAREAAEHLKQAQEKQAEASEAGARNVAKLAAVVKGQGAASADTFTGHLRQLGAEVENTLGSQGGVGRALVTIGPLLAGIGGLAQAGAFAGLGRLIGRIRGTGAAFNTLRDIEVASSAEGAAAIEANAAAGSAAMEAEGAVAVSTGAKIRAALAGIGIAGAAGGIGSLLLAGGDQAQGHLDDIGKTIVAVQSRTTGDAATSAFDKALQLHQGQPAVQSRGIDTKAAIQFLLTYGDLTDANVQKALAQLGYSFPKINKRARDLGSDNPNVASRAQHAAAVLATAGRAANGKAGAESGDAYMKGLLAQLNAQQSADAAKQAAEDRAQGIVDAISAKFQDAKSKLQGLLSDAMNLKESISSSLQQGSSLTDIFTGPNLNANNAFGSQNSFGRVRDFLTRRLAQERRFVGELRQLIAKGLSPDLVSQIASAGVDGGQRIAEAILSGGSAGVGQVNSLEQQITALADSAGGTIADDKYARQIAAARANADMLAHRLDVQTHVLQAIQSNTRPVSGSSAASQRNASAQAGV